MSSKAKDGHSDGGFHQEYIASLRYRNDLPPPEMPPKFLDIPHDGLERFLTPAYASNMARREEPNIEVDAEGGMPIDPVGIPGLHLGDESAILAPETPGPFDPADLPLLMTVEQLRKPMPTSHNVSFLRRTQYISTPNAGAKSPFIGTPTSSHRASTAPTPKPKVSKDDPMYIKKYIQKGFDIAYPQSKHTGEDTPSKIRGLPATKAEVDSWETPTHPDNPKLKPVGYYPIMPDLSGFNDTAGYVQLKFDKAPVAAVKGKRDDRMDVAIVVPSNPEERVIQEYESKKALHKANPSLYPDPGPQAPLDYDVYIPERPQATESIKETLNMNNPYRDDDENYTHARESGDRSFRYDRLRTYSTSMVSFNMLENNYKDLAMVLFDPHEKHPGSNKSSTIPHRLTQKAAYYYPILTKTRLKPERARVLSQAGLALTRGKAEPVVDQIQLALRDPNDEEAIRRAEHRAQIDSRFAKSMPEKVAEQELEDVGEEDGEMKHELGGEGAHGYQHEEREDEMGSEGEPMEE